MMAGNRKRLPRRDLMPMWAAWGWLAGAAVWFVNALFSVPYWPAAVISVVFAAPCAVIGVRKVNRVRRDPAAALRRDLLAALRALPDADGWLNRDEHALLGCSVRGLPLMRVVTIAQGDEDDHETLHEEGTVHAVAHVWQVWPWELRVERSMVGATITATPDGDFDVDTPRAGIIRHLRGQRAARKAGLLYASDDEVRALTALLRGAEAVSPDSSEGDGDG